MEKKKDVVDLALPLEQEVKIGDLHIRSQGERLSETIRQAKELLKNKEVSKYLALKKKERYDATGTMFG